MEARQLCSVVLRSIAFVLAWKSFVACIDEINSLLIRQYYTGRMIDDKRDWVFLMGKFDTPFWEMAAVLLLLWQADSIASFFYGIDGED